MFQLNNAHLYVERVVLVLARVEHGMKTDEKEWSSYKVQKIKVIVQH